MGSSVHCGMLLTCAISWIKPFLRKIISLLFDGLQIILFSLDQIKNWSTKTVRQWPLLQAGTMRVESSAYLNRAAILDKNVKKNTPRMFHFRILHSKDPYTQDTSPFPPEKQCWRVTGTFLVQGGVGGGGATMMLNSLGVSPVHNKV